MKLFMYRPLRLNEKIEVVAELDGVKDVGKATLTRIKYTFLDEEK